MNLTREVTVAILGTYGWTQVRLAEVMGVSRRQVCRWTKGEQQANPEKLLKLQRLWAREKPKAKG